VKPVVLCGFCGSLFLLKSYISFVYGHGGGCATAIVDAHILPLHFMEYHSGEHNRSCYQSAIFTLI
jgi:hypothetical protein